MSLKNKIKIFSQITLTSIFLVSSFFVFDYFKNDFIDTEFEKLTLDINQLNHSNAFSKKFLFKDSISSIAILAKFESENFDFNDLKFSYRYKYDNKWTLWDDFEFEDYYQDNKSDINSDLVFLSDTKELEIYINNSKLLVFDNLEIIFTPKSIYKNNFIKANADESLNIIKREEWGADENFRFVDPNKPTDNPSQTVQVDQDWIREFAEEIKIVKILEEDDNTGKKYIWPLEYTENVEKIVVHHSAGRIPSCEEEVEFLRSIYKFHANTRAWGDIGYNYIIGPCTGNIYEGRAGSFGVKGAHAGRFNAKTIGVMIMGNYQHEHPSSVSINSLVKLSRFLGEKYGFWPDGYSQMRGIALPNIFGHRDVANTTCPGDMLYARLPEIRLLALQDFVFPSNPHRIYGEIKQRQKESFSSEPISIGINQIFLKPGEEKNMNIMFKNIGQRDWNQKTGIKINGLTTGLKFNNQENTDENIFFMKERIVKKDEIAIFNIDVKANSDLTNRHFVFEIIPIINGVFNDEDASQRFVIIVSDKDEKEIQVESINRLNEIFNDHSTSDDIATVEFKSLTEDELGKIELFLDVKKDNIYFTYIEDLKNNNIVSGNNNYFYPDSPITRGEFSKVLANGVGFDLIDTNKSFADISGNVFEKYIRTLQSNQIVQGQNGLFYPDNFVSRAEAIKMLVKAFNLEGETNHSFQDLKNDDFKPLILIAAANEIIGKGRIFDPYSSITRAQVAKIISNARKIKKKIEI
jgi:hypothetical protein